MTVHGWSGVGGGGGGGSRMAYTALAVAPES